MYFQMAISFASADLEFAKQIGEMLEQISYIDDCDTLGQRANRKDIYKVTCRDINDACLISCRHWYRSTRKF